MTFLTHIPSVELIVYVFCLFVCLFVWLFVCLFCFALFFKMADLRGYCTPGPYFSRFCAFSQKIKQLRTTYPMDLVRNVPRNSKITGLLQVETIVVKLQ